MSNLAMMKEYLATKKTKSNPPENELIGEMINDVLRTTQKIFWAIDTSNEKEKIRKDYYGILYFSEKYIRLSKDSLDKFGLKIMEYGENESHKSIIGGDLGMREEVIREYLQLPYVERIYTYQEDSTDFFFIVAQKDMDNLSYQLSTIQLDLFDKFKDYYFEIRYVISASYDLSSIPTHSIIYERGRDE